MNLKESTPYETDKTVQNNNGCAQEEPQLKA